MTDAAARTTILIISGLGGLIAIVATIIVYGLEHRRRMRRVGYKLSGAALMAPDGTAVVGATEPAPVLSPWLAAVALGAAGVFLFATNAIDETPRENTQTFAGCGGARLILPAQLRTTSALVVELQADRSMTGNPADRARMKNCRAMVRNAVLVMDGAPLQGDTLPVVENAKVLNHRWIAKTPPAGRHKIDVVTTAQGGAFAAIVTLEAPPKPAPSTPASSKNIGQRRATPPPKPRVVTNFINPPRNCTPQLEAQPPSAQKDQAVTIKFKFTCHNIVKSVVPLLFVNGGKPVNALGPLQNGDTVVYRWTYKQSAVPDRVDLIAEEVGDMWSASLAVREPASLSNIKDGIGSLGGMVIALSGLLVGILQFVKGQKVGP